MVTFLHVASFSDRSFKTMNQTAITAVFLFLLLHVCAADPLDTPCSYNRGNYTTNTPFDNNLKTLLASLPDSAAQNQGFNYTSLGDGDDRVFGRALCRGDINSTDCETCLGKASEEIKRQCQTREALMRYDQRCQLEYGSTLLKRYNGKYPDSNGLKKTASDPLRFSRVLKELMGDLSDEAAFHSGLMFAAQSRNFSEQISIYGLVQCTRDLSNAQCGECLNSASGDLEGCCGSREGGTVYGGACSVRFEIYQFYYTAIDTRGHKTKIWVPVTIVSVLVFLIGVLVGFFAWYRQKRKHAGIDKEERSHRGMLGDIEARPAINSLTIVGKYVLSSQEMPAVELPVFDAAPEIFSQSNKLGQGGFGTVYKSVLPSGEEVAVKRLSRKSWQGVEELKNEVMLIAKLQHRNLVRLLGCALEGNEKLLIYEFMPNKSLDFFLFDREKRLLLDWKTRFNIIDGIARALVYLHEDSRLKVIHRDLKPSNILLDNDMVAKISDFGIARIFSEKHNPANTRRIVGTYGYMAPEYAMGGLFSIKSDVFSFGVIMLEIISGQRNSSFYISGSPQTLLSYAWKLLNEEMELEAVDPVLIESSSPMEEIARCIHIGLLCVQEDPAERPRMSEVVHLLKGGQMSMSKPSRPPVSLGRRSNHAIHLNPSSLTGSCATTLITGSYYRPSDHGCMHDIRHTK
ncbi:PREDICTED: cysteine-rich receptor-like protein kinase 25 [Ipomoea nil]|uniref:cysteine-rich receptor-like protein kinase 25 n=1 Tax=Ipomoea nil TaxID=35883 RepID=UPI00090195E2|nr:PREDICTED: cysteine-rich receptor-like protein kinase 25 [Ipomoea nil]XP_019171522.1 PREDICTED: cysteine-rich receptor-like protein kinase 25 [Ipomoea nil]